MPVGARRTSIFGGLVLSFLVHSSSALITQPQRSTTRAFTFNSGLPQRNLNVHLSTSKRSGSDENVEFSQFDESTKYASKLQLTRRSALLSAARDAATLMAICGITTTTTATAANADDAKMTRINTPISASWKAVDGLNSLEENNKIVSFDASAYKAMMDDPSRTPLFEKAIIQRLNAAPGGPESMTVLDLGTGPYALFAIIAAQAGAGKVYAIEANKQAAVLARKTIKQFGFDDVITVLEGFSSDVSLPNGEKADLVVAEIIGSVASEEGAFATILDAHKRLVKDPADDASWIPNRIQTFASPASYTLHNLFQPPAFDWSKLRGEPVRFNCRDQGLQLLSEPVLVEDIRFATINQYNQLPMSSKFSLDATRIEDNTIAFYEEFRRSRLGKGEAEKMAQRTGKSFTGVALWPRLILDADGKIDVNSRQYPSGKHQKSHWQTVLPIMNDVPIDVKGGDEIEVTFDFSLGEGDILTPPSYKLNGNVVSLF